MKKLLLLSILLIGLISLSVVSAQENANDITAPLNEIEEKNLNIQANMVEENEHDSISLDDNPIMTENDKQDINATIIFPDEISPYKYQYYEPYGYFMEIGNLPDDYDANMTVLIDNEFITTTNVRNQVQINTKSFAEHIITVELPETEKYAAKNITKKYTQTPVLIEIPKEVVIGENDYIKLYCSNDAYKGTFTMNINGKQQVKRSIYSVMEVSGGTVSLHYLLNFGNQYDIEVICAINNLTYTKKVTITNVTGYNLGYTVFGQGGSSVNDHWVIYGGKNNEIAVGVPSDANVSNAKITIDGISYTPIPVEPDGEVSGLLNISELNPGEHDVVVSYEDDYYPLFCRHFKLDVRVFILKPTHTALKYGTESNVFQLKLPNDASGNLKLYLSKNKTDLKNESQLYKSVSLKDGFANISVAYLPLGHYYYYAYYDGDDYNVSEQNGEFTVELNVKINYPLYIGETNYIYILSHPQDNRLLKIRISRTPEINLTLVNGSGRVLVPDLPEDWYDVMVYDENDTRLLSETEELAMFKSYVYIGNGNDIKMDYYDGTKYCVQILENGKPAVDKKVKFVIGTNVYVTTTNTYGVAKLKIKELPGTYTIKTVYNGKYASGQTSNKITIKNTLKLYSVNVKKSAKKLVLTAKLSKKLKNQKITFKFNGQKYIGYTNKKGIAQVTIKAKILKRLVIGKKVKYQATYIKETAQKTAIIKR